MHTLYVFGDSFSDPNHKHNAAGNTFWINDLENHFTVHNYSMKGSGPSYQIEKLINVIETHDHVKLKQSNMIFFMSDIHRYYWHFLKPKDQYLYPHILSPSILFSEKNRDKLNVIKEAKKYKQYKKFLKEFDRYTGLTETHNIISHFSTVYTMSKYFNKTVFWPIFNNLDCIPNIKNFVDNKFNVIDYPLIKISQNDNVDDRLKNMHLHETNHNVMTEELTSWMKKNYSINVKNFKGNITSNK